jgi:23S rRNA (uracil1939-C5)-methyltransferase
MARSSKRSSDKPQVTYTAQIESLDFEGRGIAHRDGKVVFIEGAMTHETVEYTVHRKKESYEQGSVVNVIKASPGRVTPGCPHFGVCGGCAMQHVDAKYQVAAKQRVLEDNFARIGKVEVEQLLPPIHGPTWGYRERARLSVHFVVKKDAVLVGFHERKSSFVADTHVCHILPPEISALIDPLRDMFYKFETRDRIPQLELAVGEDVTVFVLRNLVPIPEHDAALMRAFADQHKHLNIQWWLQPKGPETAHPFYPLDMPLLDYRLPEFNLSYAFRPNEFTQVNRAINRVLVSRAIRLLAPQANEYIIDLFCGLGNFTLPIARLAGAQNVIGVEGSEGLVQRAKENAARNGLPQAQFQALDLFTNAEQCFAALTAGGKVIDKLLIDPPRDGALEICKAIPKEGVNRIVYVSCNPATLARDLGVLVHTQGYTVKLAGIMNMFPHTAHVESIAVLER